MHSREKIIAHRQRLAAALFTVYFLTEGERRARGWKAASMADAFKLLETPASGECERARVRFLALAKLRVAEGRHPEAPMNAGHERPADSLPFVIVESSAIHQADNETRAVVKVLVNMHELRRDKFLHIARAVDPRSWVETGFFSDMYRLAWREHDGVPTYLEWGAPRRHLERDAQPLGELWFGSGEPGAGRHPDESLLDLVFEGFDLQDLDGGPLSTFNNIFGIERFHWDEQGLELRFRLYRSISSKLTGLPRGGGMDMNQGTVKAEKLTADALVGLFNEEVPSVAALRALEQALGAGSKLVQRVKRALVELELDPDIVKAAPAIAEDCVLVTASKNVHFTDLTPQGEPFIDLGEILNYASPLVLKPFFEQLILLGACARPDAQLRGIVEGRLEQRQ